MFVDFGYAKCNANVILMYTSLKLKLYMEALVVDIFLYQRLVGKLMFLTQTRPNISFAINMFNTFFHKPQTPHLDATKRLFHYIKRTLDLGI